MVIRFLKFVYFFNGFQTIRNIFFINIGFRLKINVVNIFIGVIRNITFHEYGPDVLQVGMVEIPDFDSYALKVAHQFVVLEHGFVPIQLFF